MQRRCEAARCMIADLTRSASRLGVTPDSEMTPDSDAKQSLKSAACTLNAAAAHVRHAPCYRCRARDRPVPAKTSLPETL